MDAAKVVVHPAVRLHQVSKYLYSHFIEHLGTCVYEGVWVGPDSKIENDEGIRTDVIAALKKIAPPALRWPGGCFADAYHWRDGIGPRKKRPRTYNIWWCQPETNQFGTDEFMRFCSMIGAEPYLALNVGSGTVEEAVKWVEYCNSSQDTTITQMRKVNGHSEPYQVKFWGIGNENWGCGGNMRPEYYADLYRQFATYVRRMAGPDARLVACGSHPFLPDWDARLLAAMKALDCTRNYRPADFIATHAYCHGLSHGERIASVSACTDAQYYSLIAEVETLDRLIKRASDAGQTYGGVEVLLDEWSVWYGEASQKNGHKQSNGLMDALFAAAAFHCFHGHKHLFMTNLAQMNNVLQSVIYTQGRRMFTTPTYHVYEMFMPHRDNDLVPVEVESPALPVPAPNFHGTLNGCTNAPKPAVSASATVAADGKKVFVSLLNLHLNADMKTALDLSGCGRILKSKVRRLTSDSIRDGNSFEDPHKVKPQDVDLRITDARFTIQLPAHSITTLDLTVA